MKTLRFQRRGRQDGFVLILVLGILILLTLLVVGFLGHAVSQVKAVTSYRAETDSLLLGDVAVNVVKAQIDEATSQLNTIWTSQPGAIRTFTDDGTDANPTMGTVYKLYSSSKLTSTKASVDIPADLPAPDATDWASNPLWTDLNAPVLKTDGKTYAYPIIDVQSDPAHLPAYDTTTTTAPFTAGSFNIDTTSATTKVGALARSNAASTSTTSPLPMPVRWLYILKQGQIITPDTSSTGATATFNSATPVPTAANPIVGRVAYWTDDDTCRVNINTASASGTGSTTTGTGSSASINTFWDTPAFTSVDDYALGTTQPYTKEYQRYSGHPATTTLTLALPEFADASGNVSTANLANVIAMTPRYANGGSVGATVTSNSQSAFTLPTNRLYASINELLFDPGTITSPVTTRTPNTNLNRAELESAKFFITAHSRAPELNLYGLPRISIWPISSLANTSTNTYLTATDSLMAFCSTTNTGTTSNGSGTYYFTRGPFLVDQGVPASNRGSNSPTSDINLPRNVALLNYLDALTSSSFEPYPGNVAPSGNMFDDKYTVLGKRQILTEIFDYIRITNSRDPGLDPSLNPSLVGPIPYAAPTAYDVGSVVETAGYGQILPTRYTTWGTYGYGRYQGIIVNADIIFVGVGKGPSVVSPQTWTAYSSSNPSGYFAVNPQNVTSTDTISGGTGAETGTPYDPLQAHSVPPLSNPNNPSASMSTDPTPGTAPAHLIPNPGQTAVEAVVVFTFFDPAMGYSRYTKALGVASTGLTTALNVPVYSTGTTPVGTQTQPLFQYDVSDRLTGEFGAFDYATMTGANPGSLGGLLDFRLMLAGRKFVNNNNAYASYSNIMNMPTGGSFLFSGGSVPVSSYYNFGPTSDVTVDNYTFTFPPATLPVPGLSINPQIGSGGNTSGSDRWNKANAQSTNTDAAGYNSTYIDSANDTIISMVPGVDTSTANTGDYRDYRMLAQPTTPAGAFVAHPNYWNSTTGTTSLSQSQRLALDLMYPSGQVFGTSTTTAPTSGPYLPPTTSTAAHGQLINTASYFQQDTTMGVNLYSAAPVVPITQTSPAYAANDGVTPPDFDNGFGELPDGPYINKPDEGAIYTSASSSSRVYYDNLGWVVAGFTSATATTTNPLPAYFSPQRQVPSPVMFGSLPTGAPISGHLKAKPWQTLLFQPGVSTHAGYADPKDEYLLDLFWMPQVLPYAISEPFSTAGKVNMNYQILPFTYIDRSTALQSVLAGEKVAQVGASQAATYKKDTAGASTGMGGALARQPLNLSEKDGTLWAFANKFSNWSVFKTAAEICGVYLVPKNESWSSVTAAQTAWYDMSSASKYSLVGDNTRERPYADIYSRLTTKSNVYTVYYRVQTLKNPGTTPASWTEGTGAITGEYRGSTTIERYLDPNVNIPDFGSLASTTLLADYVGKGPFLDGFTYNGSGTKTTQLYYKWRVVENNRFAP